jgi:predicted transcriptional regulator
MEIKQIKLLLKLLGVKGYQAKIGEVKPTSKTPITECTRICKQLWDQKLIEVTEKIEKIKLTASGKALLKEDASQLPISKKELKILTACAMGAISPSKTKVDPAKERDQLINSLRDRGFLTITQTKAETVTLTETGKTFLLKEYNPSGTNAVLSLDMLSNYLNFLRTHQSGKLTEAKPTEKLTDEEVLDVIIALDQEHNTNNYLPLFYLRDKLQPPFTREELDQVLYRLEGSDKIQLSSLTEAEGYTEEQLRAGISQPIGGALFFIKVIR